MDKRKTAKCEQCGNEGAVATEPPRIFWGIDQGPGSRNSFIQFYPPFENASILCRRCSSYDITRTDDLPGETQ